MLDPTRPVIVTLEDSTTLKGRISSDHLIGVPFPIIVIVDNESGKDSYNSLVLCNEEGVPLHPYVTSVKNVTEIITETCPHCKSLHQVEKPKPTINFLAPLFTKGGHRVQLLSYDISLEGYKKSELPVAGVIYFNDGSVFNLAAWTTAGKYYVGPTESQLDLTNTSPSPNASPSF